MNRSLLLVAIIATTIAVALLDVATSAGLVGSILFTVPLALCALHRSTGVLWMSAASACVLTAAAHMWGLDRPDTAVQALDATVNRALLAVSLLTLSVFIHRWIVTTDRLSLALAEVEHQRSALEVQGLRVERTEARYRGLLETAPDAMVIVDDAGIVVLINARAESLFGYARQELIGKSVDMLVPPRFRDQHPAHRAAYASSPRTRGMGTGLELAGLRRDGSEFPIEVSLSPLATETGTLVSSAIRDISDRRRIEAALKTANGELEAFSYSVAHDLRAPLRAMNGFAHLLLEAHGERLDAEGQDWLQEIVANTTKMDALIEALLALARVTRTDLRPESVDLSAIGRASASQLAIADPGRSVDVVVQDDLRADLDPQLARVLADNLLGNAWKFTSKVASARIELGSTQADGAPCFYVRDNGVGFDMAFADKLFAPFQRLHAGAEFPGTGIGLATVQRIVHRHGGRVWAQGIVNGGATISFTVPSVGRVTPRAA